MSEKRIRRTGHGGEAGFTLVEALVAIVVLIFGLMAVTNLLLVAASSNSVANQGTAAVAAAIRAMDFIKATTYDTLRTNPGGIDPFAVDDGGGSCAVVTAVTAWHCDDDVPGVGRVHVHWWVTVATGDQRLLYVRVRAEGTGALSATRSRAEFTTFRACTNAEAGCPK